MCLITKDNKPKIAEMDILCYKLVCYIPKEGRYVTPIQYTPFNLNQDGIFKAEGEKEIYNDENDSSFYNVSGGYIHTFRTLDTVRADLAIHGNYFQPALFECIIPKGTEYYEGVDNSPLKCYASDLIKVVRKLCIDDLLGSYIHI